MGRDTDEQWIWKGQNFWAEARRWAQRAPGLSSILAQGVDEGPNGLKLISEVIGERLGIPMSVLMGANIASEVADEKFCETTIGESPLPPTYRVHLVASPPQTAPTPLSHLLPIRQRKEDPSIRGE